jgi:hypothetical protein
MDGRHRLSDPDRSDRRPDAGHSSVSDAADRGIANGVSGESVEFSIRDEFQV